MGKSHWVNFFFQMRNSKLFYFDSFGGALDEFLLDQIPKPKIYHIYFIQGKISRLYGSYCLHFLFLIEKREYYDAILRMYFG